MHDAPLLSRRRIAGAAASLALLALGAPAVAQADSIAYIKSGNVFLATTDGAREYQVTFDGGYSTVSQADNGRMAALRGDKIRHLERDGSVIAEILTPVSTSTDPTMQFKGPFDPAISPDGTRVSYTYYWQYTGHDPYCNPQNNCYVKRLYHGTAFTDPNRLTAWDEPGFARRSGWIDAAWIDNDTVLLSDPYILPNEDTVLWSPSDANSLKRWFEDYEFHGKLKETTMSRDKSALAAIGDDGKVLSIARAVGGFYPDYPTRCAKAPADIEGEKLSKPQLTGDASRIFWASSADGIHVAGLPKFSATDCGQFQDPGKLLIAGATYPSWGPAEVPAARPAPQGPGGNTPKPTPAQTPGQPGTDSGSTAKLSVTKVKLAAALKKGLAVQLKGATNGKQTVTAKYGKTTVASGKVTVKNGGGKVTLKFSKAGKGKLKGKKTVKLSITGAGAKLNLTLKR
ncbi:hypothetical protein OJ997_35995 [Solirubrobacter phytolaccae]|uniref:Uncharacterized protein n=1 Tax=Solirubrobacter phytolaccae TaxID=1404360 RepID=A0A9X3SCF1_9ACTN|nr:hypothetical protein [Solirubrobacter phytolaccae]MDA0185763.1 hypothetical protein [Solirubrobacter phytolaccae]